MKPKRLALIVGFCSNTVQLRIFGTDFRPVETLSRLYQGFWAERYWVLFLNPTYDYPYSSFHVFEPHLL
ncbi:hypothetical protein [Nostoc sp. CHAB 5715]|uniref:hypothetical protein n=1 Tax=Nostoc sp. CHAB 5715 TaxID=2780400 RepID=UPI001E3C898B|nr:hypothetical protein [Nostoc sp. CHAB 5715]MCC5620912.1 hypothetical protein [Nostoc sp. CHAB 5715]